MKVQRELSEIIHKGIENPRTHPMAGVVPAEITPGLKFCKVHISVLGDEEAGKSTIQGLKSAEGYVRRELARRVNLRSTPELRFILDQSIKYGVDMPRLIDEVTKDLHQEETRDKGGVKEEF